MDSAVVRVCSAYIYSMCTTSARGAITAQGAGSRGFGLRCAQSPPEPQRQQVDSCVGPACAQVVGDPLLHVAQLPRLDLCRTQQTPCNDHLVCCTQYFAWLWHYACSRTVAISTSSTAASEDASAALDSVPRGTATREGKASEGPSSGRSVMSTLVPFVASSVQWRDRRQLLPSASMRQTVWPTR